MKGREVRAGDERGLVDPGREAAAQNGSRIGAGGTAGEAEDQSRAGRSADEWAIHGGDIKEAEETSTGNAGVLWEVKTIVCDTRSETEFRNSPRNAARLRINLLAVSVPFIRKLCLSMASTWDGVYKVVGPIGCSIWTVKHNTLSRAQGEQNLGWTQISSKQHSPREEDRET